MLHWNTMAFQNMQERSKYLYGRQAKDRFKALSKNGHIYEWDIQTGKRLSKRKFVIADHIQLTGENKQE